VQGERVAERARESTESEGETPLVVDECKVGGVRGEVCGEARGAERGGEESTGEERGAQQQETGVEGTIARVLLRN
jgi:hypothetical protein